MPDSSQPDGTAHVGAYVPTNHAEALFQLAQERSERADKTTQSDLLRQYLKEGLRRDVRQSDDAPEEVYDLLDMDLEADAGGDDFSQAEGAATPDDVEEAVDEIEDERTDGGRVNA